MPSKELSTRSSEPNSSQTPVQPPSEIKEPNLPHQLRRPRHRPRPSRCSAFSWGTFYLMCSALTGYSVTQNLEKISLEGSEGHKLLFSWTVALEIGQIGSGVAGLWHYVKIWRPELSFLSACLRKNQQQVEVIRQGIRNSAPSQQTPQLPTNEQTLTANLTPKIHAQHDVKVSKVSEEPDSPAVVRFHMSLDEKEQEETQTPITGVRFHSP